VNHEPRTTNHEGTKARRHEGTKARRHEGTKTVGNASNATVVFVIGRSRRRARGKCGNRTIEEQFREQAELIDRLFLCRFDEFDKKWDGKRDARFARFEQKLNARLVGLENSLEARLESKLETKLEAKLEPLRNDLAALKHAVQIVLARLPE
jgi:hypothetical protein